MNTVERAAEAIMRSGGEDLGELGADYRAQGLQPPYVTLDPAPDQVSVAPQESLLGWWIASGGADALPPVALITPSALRAYLGRLIVLEPIDSSDFRYRLYGSTIAQFVGADFTGKLLSETWSLRAWPELTRTYYLATYHAAVCARRPLYTTERRVGQAEVHVWHRLLLPFADGDASVTRVLLHTMACDNDGKPLPVWHRESA
jgi:hypothetical protein